ncbi:peroxide stress protein YaaA [Celerinatantimonas diazotrophica]|uniref:UPF0246 protein EV690_2965 n=1 Tax=Celerinatantimonas diazotrophica TaxID=412034 RepID=A0A4R1J9Y6_9GAMM|nr:peroxide stress protein YaaA [Celerinatantimonas diazotrophica]TCK47257.1 hypothetical protein EV690_2965 [Celerinatantimonas diazotrophica]CAG9296029.1 Peroxide stress resistance protein YaaA [Celerinatantimonas diazotrophica]
MLAVISPAKSLDFKTSAPKREYTQPMLLEHSQILADRAKQLTPAQIASLMKISDKLAGLNAARFTQWQTPFVEPQAKASIYAFTGDVYTGVDALSLDESATQWLNEHLRILSGLYGVLRPFDLMMPYRLEMGIKLDNSRGKDLYAFWGNIITDLLNEVIREQQAEYLINLASNEYFKSVNVQHLTVPVISPVFKDFKNGQYKIISFYAKKARGMMVRYMAENQLKTPNELLQFDVDGYRYCPDESTELTPVFKRHP